MSDVILSVENVSKEYQLGTIGAGTFGGDVQRWWYKMRGKEDPFKKIGTNDRSIKTDDDFVLALQDINFQVKRGEVLGIIGKNGAGKSTLLKLLSRVTSPTTGSIKVGGRMASLLEVGTGFHHELTGRENIFLNGAILGMTKAEIKGKLDEIIEFSGCAQYIDTPVKRYSSGMNVRLGFAVAAFLEPEILIVDEVLAVGDAEFQRKAIGKMQDVSKGEGRTVLIVSHNMSSIQKLCTRSILLENGRLILDGKTEEIIGAYLRAEEESKVDFALNEVHEGLGNFGRFRNIYLYDQSNKLVNEFLIGQPMKIEFDIDFFSDVEDLEIGFSIQTPMRNTLTTVLGHWDAIASDYKKGNYKFSCTLNEIMVFPGRYYITPWVKKRGGGVDDQIPNAIEFSVLTSPITKSNANLEIYPNMGVFHKSDWEVCAV